MAVAALEDGEAAGEVVDVVTKFRWQREERRWHLRLLLLFALRWRHSPPRSWQGVVVSLCVEETKSSKNCSSRHRRAAELIPLAHMQTVHASEVAEATD